MAAASNSHLRCCPRDVAPVPGPVFLAQVDMPRLPPTHTRSQSCVCGRWGSCSTAAQSLAWRSPHGKGQGSLWGHSQGPGSEAQLILIYCGGICLPKYLKAD